MKKLKFIFYIIIFLALEVSCSFFDNNAPSSKEDVNILLENKTDSAKYVESILHIKLASSNDSLKALSLLKGILSKKHINIQFRKNQKDSLQIPLFCDDKPKSFYFYFKNNEFFARLFNGKIFSDEKINYISIDSLDKNEGGAVDFCFGNGYINKEDGRFYTGCEFSGGSYYNRFPLWITPANPYILEGYIVEDQMSLYKTYNVGCE